MDEDEAPRDELLVAADLKFDLVATPDGVDTKASKAKLLKVIEDNNMVDFFQTCVSEGLLEKNEMLEGKMQKEVEDLLAKAKEEIENAEANEGEVEVRDAKVKEAQIITYSKAKETAVKAWEAIDGLSTGKRIDIQLTILRIALAYDDNELFRRVNLTCTDMVDKGGDWDRRNRMFVYQGLQFLRERNFKQAASYLLRVVPSFTATEVVDYETYICYCVLANILHQDRVNLKKKVVDCPEILGEIDKMPEVKKMLHGLYECAYNVFFMALVNVMNKIKADRLLSIHDKYLLHEYRLFAYDQFLRPYRSVTLETMSQEFGLSTEFLENDLCGFITEGKLKCTIDSVDGVVATRQYKQRDLEYHKVIKRGDNLINRLEKLSRTLLL